MFDVGSPQCFPQSRGDPGNRTTHGREFEVYPDPARGTLQATNNKSPRSSLAGIKNKPEFFPRWRRAPCEAISRQALHDESVFPVKHPQLMRAAVARSSRRVRKN